MRSSELPIGITSTGGFSKLKSAHASFVQNAHALYCTYIEAQMGELQTPHLGMWVNRLKTLFDQYSSTGQCAISIKMFETVPNVASRKVHTTVRDDISKLIRGRTDRTPRLSSYDPNDNSAFVEIMSPVHEDWYVCNDLLALGDKYQNTNPRWRRYYNATIVVPIKPMARNVQDTTVGFICVDSKSGTFDQDVSLSTLVFFASMLYDHLQATLASNSISKEKGPS